MSLYAISDLHLSLSDKVNKPMDGFSPEWKNHVARIEEAFNKYITDDDTVFIPGDISWGINLEEAMPDLAFIDSLPGKKILLKGNHDFWWASMKKMRGLFKSIDFIQNDAYEGEDFVLCGTRGWYFPWRPSKNFTLEESKVVFDREILRLKMSLDKAKEFQGNKKLIVASHFPPLDAEHTGTVVTQVYQDYKVDIALYGHLHGKHWCESAEGNIGNIKYYLVSCDRLDCKPIKIL